MLLFGGYNLSGLGGGKIRRKLYFTVISVCFLALLCTNGAFAVNENDTSVDIAQNSITIKENNTGTTATAKSSITQNKKVAAGDKFPTPKPLGEVHALWTRYDNLDSVNASYLKKNGVTDLFVLTPRKDPSSLKGFINKCNPVGIRVHAWIICFYQNGKFINPETGIMEGQPVQTYLNRTIKNIATNYNVSGIQLDYVRYPGTAYKDSDGSGNINDFVSMIRNTLNGVGAEKGKYIYLSATVMPETKQNAYYYGQNYNEMSKHLDFIVPMIYKGNYNQDTAWIGKTTAYIVKNSSKPVIAGLLSYYSDENTNSLPKNVLINDIKTAMKNGAVGYSIFKLGMIDPTFYPHMKVNYIHKKFTNQQIITAANATRIYIEKYKKLPLRVKIGNTYVNMAQLLHSMTVASVFLSKNSNAFTYLQKDTLPTTSQEKMTNGTLKSAAYLDFAKRINEYFANNKKAPSHGTTSLGKIGYNSQIYLFSRILSTYMVKKTLPTAVTLKSWSASNIPIKENTTGKAAGSDTIGNAAAGTVSKTTVTPTRFSNLQIITAANATRIYIEKYKKLPTKVRIGTTYVNMAQLLHSMTVASIFLSKNSNAFTYLQKDTLPTTSQEKITSGTLTKTEYLDFAKRINEYFANNKKAPSYGTTSLGKISFNSQTYLYTRVLSNYFTKKTLTSTITVKPWKASNIPIKETTDNSTIRFTNSQISKSSEVVKDYIEKYKILPSKVKVGSSTVNIAQFLYLMTMATQQIHSKTNNTIGLKAFSTPKSSIYDNVTSGYLTKSEYVNFAKRIVEYMVENNRAPNYGLTSRGEVSFQSQVYFYSRILTGYSDYNNIPIYENIRPWTAKNIPTSHQLIAFSPSSIISASKQVNAYINTNKKLPDSVNIGTDKVNMAQFLRLMTSATIQLNSKNSNSIRLYNDNLPSSIEDVLKSGNLTKAEYIDLSNRILVYMNSKTMAPSYGVIGLGKIGFKSQVSLYSKILSTYSVNKTLPSSIKLESWNGLPSEFLQYLVPTKNCQSDSPRIISLANSLTSGVTSTYDKATKLFNWVRDNVPYAWYYDSQKGALGVLDSPTANCCDHANLLVALCRAAGIPAKYKHGVCTFSSGLVVGHVWARIYVNGTWYDGDAVTKRNDFGVIRNWNTGSYKLIGEYTSLPF